MEATAWEAATLGAEQRQQWARADQARLRWASCLHRLGHCDEAVTALRQAWGGTSITWHGGLVVAAILCMRLLGRCGRQDEAGALWSVIETRTTPAIRRWALNELLDPSNSDLNEAGAYRHGEVCVFRRREARAPRPERAHRTAPATVKHSFEKVGDHGEPKARNGPADTGTRKDRGR